jgi:hypothetical protein
VEFSDTILCYWLIISRLEKIGFLIEAYTPKKTFAINCTDAFQ